MRTIPSSTRAALLCAVFVAGLLAGHALTRDASAETPHATSSILVPATGLTFRAPDGTLIATLSRDARGAFFEFSNGDGKSTTRIPEDYRPGPGF